MGPEITTVLKVGLSIHSHAHKNTHMHTKTLTRTRALANTHLHVSMRVESGLPHIRRAICHHSLAATFNIMIPDRKD